MEIARLNIFWTKVALNNPSRNNEYHILELHKIIAVLSISDF